MVQPVWRVVLREFNFAGFDTIDNAHMEPIIAHDFHVLLDLPGHNHGGNPCACFERTPALRLSSELSKIRNVDPRLSGKGRVSAAHCGLAIGPQPDQAAKAHKRVQSRTPSIAVDTENAVIVDIEGTPSHF